MQDQMHRMEASLTRVESMLHTLMNASSEKQRAAEQRRLQYVAAKEMRERGKVSLPTFHVIDVRDQRIQCKVQEWALAGMRFGRADKPELFLEWICYQWNSCCYLKKPLTYSGGYFRVHTGSARHNYGPFDLMGLNNKNKDLMQNDGHLTDFRNRPWWNWAYNVLFPVYTAMEDLPGFGDLPERFLKGVRLVLGGYGGHEVYTEIYWDPNETRANLNRMLKRVGLDVRLMWRACGSGLRMKTCPPVPP